MRTTIKKQRELRAELRKAVGVRRNRDAMPYISAFREVLAATNPAKSPLIFGYYAGGTWSAYWLDQQCRERFVYFTTDEWVHDPLLAAQRVAACPN